MKMAKRTLTGILVGVLFVATAGAQRKAPETRNAALRYWQAFSELKDEQTDKATRDLLEGTAAGAIPWNEERLGKILDENLHAIQIMQRASNLPECDWGLEREADEPVALVYRSRVLARLNTLQGMRLAAKGDPHGAVEAWIAGVRFSQHLASGGTLIFALVARTALLSDVSALKNATEKGVLDAKSRAEASAALSALPATGLDWGSTWNVEAETIENSWQTILKARDPKAKYKELMNEELTGKDKLPTVADLAAFRGFMGEVAAALRMPPGEARDRLQNLREREKSLNPLLQDVIPNFEKVNTQREELLAAREAAIIGLAAK
jgi:hypothetical protein